MEEAEDNDGDVTDACLEDLESELTFWSSGTMALVAQEDDDDDGTLNTFFSTGFKPTE
jgi:hypothetical protein